MQKIFKYFSFNRHIVPIGILCLLAICIVAQNQNQNTNTMPVQGSVPPTNSGSKVYLLNADTLSFDKSRNANFQILRGDVKFRHDSSYMYCDSAYFYEKTNSLDAFGNVRMEQGDTLFVYGDLLYYNGNTKLAKLRQNVRMENRDVVLFTDSLNFDQMANIGYYFDGGKIVDNENNLSSVYGQYSPDTKIAVYQYQVKLVNPKFTLYSDTLIYNTATNIAKIVGPSTIISDSNTIYTDRGSYDTNQDFCSLYNRSRIVSKSQVLIGDTIYYDRKLGFGEVFGNMFMNDTARKMTLEGQYGYYNEFKQSAFATDSALAKEYSKADTLFLHADTLRSSMDSIYRVLQAYYGVRFFRTSAQGVCDSLRYSTRDSVLCLYKEPILWNEKSQINGDTILVYTNDSSIDWAHIKKFAFTAQEVEPKYYNQLTGKDLKAFFTAGKLTKVDVSGNVQTIFFPSESDSTIVGLNNAESSFMTVYLKEQKMQKIIMWPQVQGTLTPLPMVNSEQLYLPAFKWYDYLRPAGKFDIFRKVFKKTEDIPKKVRRSAPQ